ncbi:MAG: hypothetical protein JNM56_14120 [Planctomycetia bacterium]|nr:hypothetical protein [Planctomycetia bacterium]
MTDSLLFRLQCGKSRAIEEVVEAWKAEHAGAMAARDVEELVRECLRLPDEMRRIYREIFDRFTSGNIEGYHDIGKALQAQFEGNLRFMDSVRDMARRQTAAGHTIEGAAELERVLEDIRPKVQEIFERWPWMPTEEEVAEAKAEIARGNYQTVDEILDELRRKNS